MYQSGDFIKAEIGIRNALREWPNNAELLRLGALVALSINQIVTAKERLDQASKLTPSTAEIENLRGNIFKAAADWADAESAYDLAEKISPSYKPVNANRLDLFLKSGQPERVLDLVDSSTDFGEMGVFAKSQALTNLGRYDEALALIVSITPQRYGDQLCLQKIKCLAALGELEKMRSEFELFSLDSTFAKDAFEVCVNAFEMRGLRAEAINLVTEVTQQPECGVMVLIQGVRVLSRLHLLDEAKIALREGIKKHSNDPDMLAEKASSLFLEGQSAESCELFMQALRLRPADLGFLMGYAQAALLDGQYAEARNAIQGAMLQAPNNQFLIALLASVARKTDNSHRLLYDYDSLVQVYDLSPPQGYSSMEDFNGALKAVLNKLHVYVGTPTNQSLRNGTQTQLDLSLVDDPVIQTFFRAIDHSVRDYLTNLGNQTEHPLRKRNTGNYRIFGAWSVRLQPGGFHVNHVHPMGWISSTYYVDIPDSINEKSKQGWIKFGEPAIDLGQSAEYFVQPKVGRLVLFPSYMWHGTLPFEGENSRLTLPFDIVPA